MACWCSTASHRPTSGRTCELEEGYGLPAFNVNNMEQIKAIMDTARTARSPVILQGSVGARKYAGEAFLRHLVAAAVEAYPEIPIVMHQDHGASPAVCMA